MAAPVDQKYFFLLDLIDKKLSKDDYTFNGFECTYANNYIRPPKMLYARGDFRTIHIGWVAPIGYSNTSHYLLQVSDDDISWKGLVFDGTDFGGNLGTLTTVYSTTIAHTRIPYNNGSIRTLYYRAATVSKNGEVSEWSESISGNTFFVEESDMRDGFVWFGSGKVITTGEANSGQFDYIASGSIQSSGGSPDYAYYDYISYMASGNIEVSGQAITLESNNYTLVNIGNRTVRASKPITYNYYTKNYYEIHRVVDGRGPIALVFPEAGTVMISEGGIYNSYEPETSQMIALDVAGYITYTLKSWSSL